MPSDVVIYLDIWISGSENVFFFHIYVTSSKAEDNAPKIIFGVPQIS